jgi:hypothetical protein
MKRNFLELEALRARIQDLVVMVLDGRETREDEPVRDVSPARFVKALAKARTWYEADSGAR